MKKPIRTVESRYGDKVIVDFKAMTITRITDGIAETEGISSKELGWRFLREAKWTFNDREY